MIPENGFTNNNVNQNNDNIIKTLKTENLEEFKKR
jgi:hypothetical protein